MKTCKKFTLLSEKTL